MKTGMITLAAALLATYAGAAAGQTSVTTGHEGTNVPTKTTGTNGTTGTTGTTGTGGTTGNGKDSLPTKNHSALITSMIGRWQTTTKVWSTPESEPQKATGITTMSATLGGRFVQQEFASSMGGTSFKGTGYFGFNTTNGQFESFWIDNCSTGMTVSTGNRESDGSIVWNATFTDEKGQTQSTRSVTRFPAKDTIVFETYATSNTGGEFKTLEVTYNRTNQVAPAGNNRVTNATRGTTTGTTTASNGTNGTNGTTTTTDASQTGTETTGTPR